MVYVDANHEYGPVLSDLEAWEATLRRGGLLMGHDFATHGVAKPGVIEAVKVYLERRPEFRLLAITCEHFPSFVLGRRGEGVHPLVANIYRRLHAKIMVPEAEALSFRQNRLFGSGLTRSSVMAFGPSGRRPQLAGLGPSTRD